VIYSAADYRDGLNADAVDAWDTLDRLWALYARCADAPGGRRLVLDALRSIARLYLGARIRYPAADSTRSTAEVRQATILSMLTLDDCVTTSRGTTRGQALNIAADCQGITARFATLPRRDLPLLARQS
jgi:hypothetical protein